jgi:hypothetical protein
MTFELVEPSVSGPGIYAPVLSPVYAYGDSFSSVDAPNVYQVSSYELQDPTTENCIEQCLGNGDGYSYIGDAELVARFDTPVSYVSVQQTFNFTNGAWVQAFNSANQLVGYCVSWIDYQTGCTSYVSGGLVNGEGGPTTTWDFSISDADADISTIVVAGLNFPPDEVESIQYGSVPEPATFSLLGLGLAGVGFMRRRKTA